MANPFKKFRKNRRQMLVFLTVVCMLTFVIGGTGASIIAGAWGCSRHVDFAVETKVRTITRTELNDMRIRRRNLNQLLREIAGFSFGGDGNGEVFDTWLKAQKARDMGIEVSDDAITAFIRLEVIDRLVLQAMQQFDRTGTAAEQAKRTEQLKTIAWNQLHEGMKRLGFEEVGLFAALRTELLARRLDEMFFGFQQSALTPPERKEAWDMLHRRAHAEVLPVRVQDFVPQVGQPSDEELKRFFELYARRLPDPDSPLPGFTLPHLAQFQYFQANAEAFDAAERPVVTAAEIKARYEQEAAKAKTQENHRMKFNRERWLKELSDAKAKAKEKAESGGAEKKTENKTEKKAEGAAKPADKEKPATEKASPGTKGDGGAAAHPVTSPASDTAGPRVFPVAFQTDEKAKSPSDAAADSKTASGEKKPAEKSAGDTTPASDAKKEAAGGKTEPKPKLPERTLNSILLDLKVPQDIREGKDPEVEPLWREEEDLRNKLAEEHAKQDIERLLGYLKDSLGQHAAAWEKWNARPAGRPEPPSPLSDPQQRMKLIRDAWNQLVEKRKEEWTEALKKEKTAVEAELKRLADEQKLSADDFRRRAEETKKEAWLQLLADQKRLANVDKTLAELVDKWSGPLVAHLTNFGPLSAPPPGGKAQIALIYQQTDPNLTMREFEARSYGLSKIEVDFRNLNSMDQLRERRLNYLFNVSPYQPTVAGEMFNRSGDQLLFWKIADRAQKTPIWEHAKDAEAEYDAVLVDREYVEDTWKKVQARDLARKRAEQLAADFRRDVKRFPIAEVGGQRYFRIESGGPSPVELTSQQREEMNFVAAQAPLYGVAVEIFENDHRRTLDKPTTGRAPLEAPPRSIFSTLAEAEQQAQRMAQESTQANLLVIVGQSIGTLDTEPTNRLVFRGVKGFYRPQTGETEAKDAKAAPATPAVIRWPGMVASDRDVEIRPFGGDRNQPALFARGVSLRPFTWRNESTREATSTVDGVDKPGDTFFETTFGLNRGELGVAFNEPRTVAYVIQVADYDYQVQGGEYPDDFTSAKSPLPERFTQDSAGGFRDEAMRETRQRYIRWIRALEEEYRVVKSDAVFARGGEE